MFLLLILRLTVLRIEFHSIKKKLSQAVVIIYTRHETIEQRISFYFSFTFSVSFSDASDPLALQTRIDHVSQLLHQTWR